MFYEAAILGCIKGANSSIINEVLYLNDDFGQILAVRDWLQWRLSLEYFKGLSVEYFRICSQKHYFAHPCLDYEYALKSWITGGRVTADASDDVCLTRLASVLDLECDLDKKKAIALELASFTHSSALSVQAINKLFDFLEKKTANSYYGGNAGLEFKIGSALDTIQYVGSKICQHKNKESLFNEFKRVQVPYSYFCLAYMLMGGLTQYQIDIQKELLEFKKEYPEVLTQMN